MDIFGHQSQTASSIEAVCFDAFGTLVKITDRRNVGRRLLSLVEPRQRRVFKERLLIEDRSIAEWCDLFEVNCAASVLEGLENDVRIEAASVRMRPKMADIWTRLRDEGLRLGVCSNLAASYGASVLAALPDHPDATVFSFEVGYSKPDPAMYIMVVQLLEIEASQILFIGDTPSADIEGPRKAGLRGIHVDDI